MATAECRCVLAKAFSKNATVSENKLTVRGIMKMFFLINLACATVAIARPAYIVRLVYEGKKPASPSESDKRSWPFLQPKK